MTLQSQNARILEYLQTGQKITALEALDKFKCFRLASRIADLKSEGHKIAREFIGDGTKKYARYYMEVE